MNVTLRACDVQITAEQDRPALLLLSRRERVELFEELHLGGEVLAAVRHIDRCHRQLADLDGDNAMLEVEGWVGKRWAFRRERLTHVDRDAGIPFASVPIAP